MESIFDEKNGIWLVDESNKSFHLFDKQLAETLAEFFTGYSVVDLGCGLGDYVKTFRDKGIVCDGFDGNPNTRELTGGLCNVLDLSKSYSLYIPVYDWSLSFYDWSLSLEVGEHIPKEFEDIFIDNLHFANSKGIVLSWAVEGQGGIGHVNCRNNDYIIQKIEKLGYKYNPFVSNVLREKATFPYFKNTLMVFNKI